MEQLLHSLLLPPAGNNFSQMYHEWEQHVRAAPVCMECVHGFPKTTVVNGKYKVVVEQLD